MDSATLMVRQLFGQTAVAGFRLEDSCSYVVDMCATVNRRGLAVPVYLADVHEPTGKTRFEFLGSRVLLPKKGAGDHVMFRGRPAFRLRLEQE